MILKIIRWIYGYVQFMVTDGNIEKFINLSVKHRNNFWDIKKSGNYLHGKISIKEYKYLHKTAKETNSKVRLKRKYGLPFFIRKYKLRWGFFLGIFLYIGMLQLMSLYVWDIKVEGNKNMSEQDILTVMNNLGVSGGTLKSHIDVPMIKQYAMMGLPDISWLSINMCGSIVKVAVKEKTKTPEFVDTNKPCNIRASYDGQVERVETYKGTCNVNIGDAVIQGQMLINGVVEDYFGSNTFVHASGKIFARTKHKMREEITTNTTICNDTGKTINRYKIKILGIEIPFRTWENIDSTYRLETENSKLTLFGAELPISIYTEKWYEQMYEEKQIDFNSAKIKASENIDKKFKNEFIDVQILGIEEKVFEENDISYVENEYICIEDIGKEEEILFG